MRIDLFTQHNTQQQASLAHSKSAKQSRQTFIANQLNSAWQALNYDLKPLNMGRYKL